MIQSENYRELIYEINNFNPHSTRREGNGNKKEKKERVNNNDSTLAEHYDYYDDGRGNFEKIKESNDPFLFKFYESNK